MEELLHREPFLFLPGDIVEDGPAVHHDEAVPDRDGVPHIMRDHQRRELVLLDDLPRKLQNLRSGLRIQSRRVLVKEQQFRPLQRRHKEGECLPLSPGEKLHLRPHPALESELEPAQRLPVELSLLLLHGPAESSPLPPPIGEGEILLDLHIPRGPLHRVLKYSSDIFRPPVLRHPRDIRPVDLDHAGIRLVNTRDHI